MDTIKLNQERIDVCIEVKNMMNCLINENVKGNLERELDVWCLIFSRFLKLDGKRTLYVDNVMRNGLKQRAHEALDYPNHPNIIDLATQVNNFLYRVEYLGIGLEDIREEQL